MTTTRADKRKAVILSAVLASWLKDERALTAAEIAELTGGMLSAAQVRNAIADDPQQSLSSRWDSRPSHSTNYPGMYSGGVHRARVYEPSKSYLRELLNAAKKGGDPG